MTRDDLLKRICPNALINNCRFIGCSQCNEKLNEWLDEYEKHVIEQYKADTNLKDTIREIHNNVAREMYCKGIDELVQKVKKHQYVLSDIFNNKDYGMFTIEIEQIAKELKAGVKNDN